MASSFPVMAGAEYEPWSGPGIVQSFIKLRKDSEISQETLEKWWDEIYMPALLKTGVVKSAWRWKAANPNYGKPHMVIYKVQDMAEVQAQKLSIVSRTSSTFPHNGAVDDFVELEVRCYSLRQLYETTKQTENSATTIIYAGMQLSPGGEGDLDAWYREEHNAQMSKEPGWKRTTRFSLLHQQRNDERQPDGLDFLAIHEFGDGHRIGQDVMPLDPMTAWTKRCMRECKAIDAAVYLKVKSFGEAADVSEAYHVSTEGLGDARCCGAKDQS